MANTLILSYNDFMTWRSAVNKLLRLYSFCNVNTDTVEPDTVNTVVGIKWYKAKSPFFSFKMDWYIFLLLAWFVLAKRNTPWAKQIYLNHLPINPAKRQPQKLIWATNKTSAVVQQALQASLTCRTSQVHRLWTRCQRLNSHFACL